jgi:hypothetical protein
MRRCATAGGAGWNPCPEYEAFRADRAAGSPLWRKRCPMGSPRTLRWASNDGEGAQRRAMIDAVPIGIAFQEMR